MPVSYVNQGSFNFSEAEWVQPTANGDSNYSNYKNAPDASFWTGIGVSNLIQAGADSINTSTPTYKFWVEDYPAGTQWQDRPVVNAGDTLFVDISYLGNLTTTWELDNESTNVYTSFTTSTQYVGNKAANFINERVGNFYLPDFGSATFTENYYGNNSNFYTLTTNNDRWIMTSNDSSSGTVLSSPTSVSSGQWTDDWQHRSPFTNNC